MNAQPNTDVFGLYTDLLRHRDCGEISFPPLPDFLRESPPGQPAVDLGAGTGLGTLALASLFPDRELLAIESSPTMLAALLTRLIDRNLTNRVSVLPVDFLSLGDQETKWGCALASHVFCQLTQTDRMTLWDVIRRNLHPDGMVVVDRHFGLQGTPGEGRPLTAFARLGSVQLLQSFEPVSLDEGDMVFRETYEWIFKGAAIRTESRRGRTPMCSIEQGIDEAESSGLTLAREEGRWLMLQNRNGLTRSETE